MQAYEVSGFCPRYGRPAISLLDQDPVNRVILLGDPRAGEFTSL